MTQSSQPNPMKFNKRLADVPDIDLRPVVSSFTSYRETAKLVGILKKAKLLSALPEGVTTLEPVWGLGFRGCSQCSRQLRDITGHTNQLSISISSPDNFSLTPFNAGHRMTETTNPKATRSGWHIAITISDWSGKDTGNQVHEKVATHGPADSLGRPTSQVARRADAQIRIEAK